SFFVITTLPAASTPCTWNTFLARSIPSVVTCMWTAPSCDSSPTTTLWHFDAVSGRRPPHQNWKPIGGPGCVLFDSQYSAVTDALERIGGRGRQEPATLAAAAA